MAEPKKWEFKVEEVENGFIVITGDRRFVSSREPSELIRNIASVLGVDAGEKKKARKEKGGKPKLPAAPAT